LFDILRDLVITPCGVSYERNVILDDNETAQNDLITREPLDPSQLVPTFAILG